jgi:hypothetical protein
VLDEIHNLTSVKRIRFVLYNEDILNVFENTLESLLEKQK